MQITITRKISKFNTALLFIFMSSCFSDASYSNPPSQITIIQIIPHQALDSSRIGLIEKLKDSKIPINIAYENANGNIATALQIAQKAVGNKSDVIITLGTGASQAAQRATNCTGTPVVIVSVTDPVGSKLVKSMQKPGGNITGVTNRYPIIEQLKLFKRVQPNLKTIGTIYNPSEANSLTLLADLEESAKKLGLKVVARVATKSGEVKAATESLIGDCEGVYIFDDNTALSAFSTITLTCNPHKIPVYASNPEFVEQGALLSKGANQTDLGRQAADYVLKIIKGSSPKDLAVTGPVKFTIAINYRVAKNLGIKIPADLVDS